jgi:hypothetical protein
MVDAGQLVGLFESKLQPHLSSRPEETPRHMAAAALVRSAHLFRGMEALYTGGLGDLAAILLRSIVECWYLAFYLLLAPEEAMEKLWGNHAYQLRQFDDSWRALGMSIPEASADDAPHKWTKISKRVSELFAAEGDARLAERALRLYAVLYREQSLMDVHGGYATLIAHVRPQSDGRLSVADAPERTDVPENNVIMAGGLVADMAAALARRFGVNSAPFEAYVAHSYADGTEAMAEE